MDIPSKCPMHDGQPTSTCPVSHENISTQAGDHSNNNHVMRAIRVHKHGGPDVLTLDTDVPKPELLDQQVLIKVFTMGVNPYDVETREGLTGDGQTFPFIPGAECAGIIEAKGQKVTKFQIGDRVYIHPRGHGSYAEYYVAPETAVCHLHGNLTFSQGAALAGAYFTAYIALFTHGQAKAGQNVLIHGASGGVGLACCQLGRAYGLHLAGTAGSQEGMDLAKQHGLHCAVNHNEAEHTDQLMAVTRGEGFDVIVEMATDKNLQDDLYLVKKRGTIILVGSGRVEFDPALLLLKQASIKGINALDIPYSEVREVEAAIYAGVGHGWIKPFVGKEYPLSAAADAHRDLQERNGYGKIILSVS